MMAAMEPAADRSHATLAPTTLARRVHRTFVPMLEDADAIVYVMVGAVFLVAALGMLGYSVIVFAANLHATGFALAVVTLVNDLLLVMIIMEVLRTVLSYLQERGTSLQPFLFIAAISATRRILAIGAQMSVAGENLTAERFQRAMLDLAANAGAILAIAVALYLLTRPASESGAVDSV
ncbi:MAG: hypothetical protein IVW54_18650 [Candidatus Binataceae bacterium]|nr:hypothetical protein [Candidatus Binataceae bacterium]